MDNVMSHEQAVSKQAVERYLLAQLSQEEREAFEGHYFDCPACFEQVQLATEFLSHTREVLNPEPEKGWLARALADLRRPAPAFASAALVLVVGIGGYQQHAIAGLKAPRIESRYVLTGQAKGEASAKVLRVSRKAGLSLKVEFLRKPEFASYEAQIVSASGKVKSSLPLPAAVTDDSVAISLAADTLDSGIYSVVVYGLSANGARTETPGGGAFDLQFVD